MNEKQSTARIATVVGLVGGAVGIAIQFAAGVKMPIVPPGVVMLLASAALIAITSWRWAPIAGIVAGLAEVAGFLAVGSAASLTDFDSLGVLTGSWVRLVGIATAMIAGVVATKVAYTKRVPQTA